MNTILGGSSGVMFTVMIRPLIFGDGSATNKYDISALSNGLLSGLVSVTGSCNGIEPWGAILIGFVGGMIYTIFAQLNSLNR